MEEIDFFERGGGTRFYNFFQKPFLPTFLLPLWVQIKFWFGIKIFHTFLQTLNGLLTLRYPNSKAKRRRLRGAHKKLFMYVQYTFENRRQCIKSLRMVVKTSDNNQFSLTADLSEGIKDSDVKCWHSLYSSLQFVLYIKIWNLQDILCIFDSLETMGFSAV